MARGNLVKVGLLFAAVFGFAAGMASVHAGITGDNPCCTIPASATCTEGIGQVRFDGICHYCFPCDSLCHAWSKNGFCPTQVAPDCN